MTFIVLGLMFKSLIHLKLIFAFDVGKPSTSCGYTGFPKSVVEETILSLLGNVANYLVIHVRVWASLVAQNLPATQEMQVQSLDREDTMEDGMATHPSVPAWSIPWTEEPVGYGL